MKTVLSPIARLVRRFGTSFIHSPAVSARKNQPWKPGATSDHTIEIKGLIQQFIPVRDSDLPDGQVRSVAILVIDGGITVPAPGDYLEADNSRWRIQTILPIGKSRGSHLVEAVLTGQGG
jgi:hypothetical protein